MPAATLAGQCSSGRQCAAASALPAGIINSFIRGLFERTHFEVVYLFLGEVAPAAAGEVFLGESGEIHTVEFGYVVAEALEDSADDAVASRMDFDTCLVAVGLGGVAYGVGMDGAVVELDAVGNALHVVLGDVAVAPDVVYLLFHELGMCELGSEIAVVGEEQHACCVAVETPHGVDALIACTFHEVEHCGAAIGVVAGGHAVFWLVEQHIAFALEGYDLLVVFHNIGVCDFGSEFGYDLSVDLHQSLLDEFVGFAARAYAGVAHVFVEAYLFVRIVDFHFVFHGLGPWHEAFAACGEACLSGTLVAVVAIGTLAALIIVIIGALLIAAGALTSLVIVVVGALLVAAGALTTLVVVVGALLVPAGALATLVVVGALLVPAGALATLVIVVVGALLVPAGALAALVAVGALTVGTLLIARRFRGAFGRHVAVAVVVGALRPGLVGTRLIASLASIWPLLIAAGALLIGALLAIRIFTGVFAVAVFVVIG